MTDDAIESQNCGDLKGCIRRDNEPSKNETTTKTSLTNYIVLSEGGKPIWFRYGEEAEITRICGFFQVLRSSALDNDLGDLQTLHAPSHTLVFWTIQCITLVAIDYAQLHKVAFLRLQLEYIYAQIIFTMTDQIQTLFRQDPSLDLRHLLGRTTPSILDCTTGTVLTMGTTTIPLQPELRQALSQSLRVEPANNLLFALVLSGTSLVTLVQPAVRSVQLRGADWHLLTTMFQRRKQRGQVMADDLWLPLCLPHVHSSGYLHCLVHPINKDLTLWLVSPDGSTEQLEALRQMKHRVRVAWSLDKDTRNTDAVGDSAKDYVDASGEGDGILPYLPEPELGKQLIQSLSRPSSLGDEYLRLIPVSHFCFRVNVPIVNSSGHLTQCFSWPRNYDNEESCSIWFYYQRLCLRLRLGSSTEEATLDTLDMIREDHGEAPTIGRDCPTMGLLEAPPNLQGVSFLSRGSDTYLAMNGREFELYLTVNTSMPAEEVAAMGARLTRRLLQDQDRLFLSQPLTWRN